MDPSLRWDDNNKDRCGMNNSDWNNPRRLIRRIEVLSVGAQNFVPPGAHHGVPLHINKLLVIGLATPIEQLKKNIKKRIDERLQNGLLDEIKDLIKDYGWNEVLRNTTAIS